MTNEWSQSPETTRSNQGSRLSFLPKGYLLNIENTIMNVTYYDVTTITMSGWLASATKNANIEFKSTFFFFK